jgi:putative transposase
MGPELPVADGAPGFWQAIEEVWSQTRGQRCWVHKTANVLNKLPKSKQPKAKPALQEIWMAETKKDARVAFDAFVKTWRAKYDKAADCLNKDHDALLPSTTFPPSTGSICGRPMSSKARSRRSATARSDPRDVSRTKPRSP